MRVFLQNMDFCWFFSCIAFVIVLFQEEVAKCWSLWCQRFIYGKLSGKIKPFDINYPSFTREQGKSYEKEKWAFLIPLDTWKQMRKFKAKLLRHY